MEERYKNILLSFDALQIQAHADRNGLVPLQTFSFLNSSKKGEDDEVARSDTKEKESEGSSFFPSAEHFDWTENKDNIPPKGKKISISVSSLADLEMVILKTDTTALSIPEFLLESPASTGRFTTVSKFLEEMQSSLQQSCSYLPPGPQKQIFKNFLDEMDRVLAGTGKCTLIFDDPLGLARVIDPLPSVTIQEYERSWAQRDEYGLNHNKPSKQYFDEEGIEKLTELVTQSKKILFLTGAGVSTESGIPAFRGNAGIAGPNIWDRFSMEDEVFSNWMALERCRVNYWRRHLELSAICANAKPNPCHTFAVDLAAHNFKNEEKNAEAKKGEEGKLLAVLTQNIDGLYQIAGLDEAHVLELHGTTRRVRCMKCRQLYDPEETIERVKRETQKKKEEKIKQLEAEGLPIDESELDAICVPPYCTVEGCDGPLKPDTISFGQPLEEEVLSKARELLTQCDLFIIMGTSLRVFPVAGFPTVCFDRNVPVAILNMDETQYDEYATVSIAHKPCGEAIKIIQQRLKESSA